MIGAIPAGGYVKITGMNPDELRKLDLRLASRSYYTQAPWRRVVVILAGPGVNILIAFLAFWVVLLTANTNGALVLSNMNPSIQTLSPATRVLTVQEGRPAFGMLKAGDRILSIDGHKVTVTTAIGLINKHRCAGAQVNGCRSATPVHMILRRGGRTISLSLYPRYEAQLKRMLLGFSFGASAKSFSALAAAGVAVREMWGVTTGMLTNLAHALTSSKARKQISSIVGITEVTQEAVAAGAGYALVVGGFVSLALAIINLFPFLPLDGGHVLWSLLEKVRGRRVSLVVMWRISSVGIVLLLFLVLNGFGNDIGRLGG